MLNPSPPFDLNDSLCDVYDYFVLALWEAVTGLLPLHVRSAPSEQPSGGHYQWCDYLS